MTNQQGAGMPDDSWLNVTEQELKHSADKGAHHILTLYDVWQVMKLVRFAKTSADLATADKPELKTTTNFSCAPEIEGLDEAIEEATNAVIKYLTPGSDVARHMSRIIEAARAYASQSKADQWQPIETAPKDGTRILLYEQKPHRSPHLPSWAEDFTNEIEVGYFSQKDNKWRLFGQYWDESDRYLHPKLWMPIALPKGAADAN